MGADDVVEEVCEVLYRHCMSRVDFSEAWSTFRPWHACSPSYPSRHHRHYYADDASLCSLVTGQ